MHKILPNRLLLVFYRTGTYRTLIRVFGVLLYIFALAVFFGSFIESDPPARENYHPASSYADNQNEKENNQGSGASFKQIKTENGRKVTLSYNGEIIIDEVISDQEIKSSKELYNAAQKLFTENVDDSSVNGRSIAPASRGTFPRD